MIDYDDELRELRKQSVDCQDQSTPWITIGLWALTIAVVGFMLAAVIVGF